MRDDIGSDNLGQAPDEYDKSFFWQTYRKIEQWRTSLLSRGPIRVSSIDADTATIGTAAIDALQTDGLTVNGNATVTGTMNAASGGVTGAWDVGTALTAQSGSTTGDWTAGGVLNGASGGVTSDWSVGGVLTAASGSTTGNWTVGNDLTVTGGGINFPAAQVAHAGVNVLDDYEEGTFTATISFAGAAVGITYSNQIGQYVKIGKRCFFNIYLTLTAKGTSTGQVRINLPFTAASSCYSSCSGSYYANMALPVACFPSGYVQASGSYVVGLVANTTGAHAAWMDTHFTNTSTFMLAGHFDVA